MGLGDAVKAALDRVGFPQEAAARWLGPECGCEERRRRLNALGYWAEAQATAGAAAARAWLRGILGPFGDGDISEG